MSAEVSLWANQKADFKIKNVIICEKNQQDLPREQIAVREGFRLLPTVQLGVHFGMCNVGAVCVCVCVCAGGGDTTMGF